MMGTALNNMAPCHWKLNSAFQKPVSHAHYNKATRIHRKQQCRHPINVRKETRLATADTGRKTRKGSSELFRASRGGSACPSLCKTDWQAQQSSHQRSIAWGFSSTARGLRVAAAIATSTRNRQPAAVVTHHEIFPHRASALKAQISHARYKGRRHRPRGVSMMSTGLREKKTRDEMNIDATRVA